MFRLHECSVRSEGLCCRVHQPLLYLPEFDLKLFIKLRALAYAQQRDVAIT